MDYEIFISYKRDYAKDFAKHLKKGLGKTAFLDLYNIPKAIRGTEKWFDSVDEAIKKSNIIALILTAGCDSSSQIRRELSLARKIGDKKFIYFVHDDLVENRDEDLDKDLVLTLDDGELKLGDVEQVLFETKEQLLRQAHKVISKLKNPTHAGPKSQYDLSVEEMQGHITEAKKYPKDDTRRIQAYLEAAKSAVQYLIEESQQISLQAREINVNEPKEIEQLVKRINNYLFVDDLRFKLKYARKGLKALLKSHKQQGDIQYTDLLARMTISLDALSGDLRHRQDPIATGVGAEALHEILDILKTTPKTELKKRLDNSLVKYGVNLSTAYDNWGDLLSSIMVTYDDLNTAFKQPAEANEI